MYHLQLNDSRLSFLAYFFLWKCTFEKVRHQTWYFTFSNVACVPELGAKFGPGFCLECAPDLPRTETQLNGPLNIGHTNNTLRSLIFTSTWLHHCREHHTVFDPSISLLREEEYKKAPEEFEFGVTASQFSHRVVTFTPSELSLCFFRRH